MTRPNLDEVTKKALNELTLEEIDDPTLESIRKIIGTPQDVERERWIRRDANSPYTHEILWYGVEAIAHVHLMRRARDVSRGKLSVDEFVSKYSLIFNDYFIGKFSVPLRKIESDRIFIPKQAYQVHSEGDVKKRMRKVFLFNEDYGNRIRHDRPDKPDPWPDKQYAHQLIKREWQPSDLENQELVEQGVKFGQDMWRTCVDGFEWYKEDMEKQGRPQGQVITDLGRKLITYYSALVFEPTNPTV